MYVGCVLVHTSVVYIRATCTPGSLTLVECDISEGCKLGNTGVYTRKFYTFYCDMDVDTSGPLQSFLKLI